MSGFSMIKTFRFGINNSEKWTKVYLIED